MNDVDDVQLQKKAQRRLVGAIVFFVFAALVLPSVMDQAPPPPPQAVEVRIPHLQDEPLQPVSPVQPKVSNPSPPSVEPEKPQDTRNIARIVSSSPATVTAPAGVAPVVEPRSEDPKPEAAQTVKPETKPVETKPDKKQQEAEAKRIADILAGKVPNPPAAQAANVSNAPVANASEGLSHVILIGAFSNASNVANLKTKLSELGIPVYTETLGEKTRVRAGPFSNRTAAERALEKMQRIGVSGDIATR